MSVQTGSSYDALRAAIVSGDIAPDARLVEADVSATFGMSRGAVRTALIRLEQDGLVVREPHRGARVRKVSNEEAVEILQARAVLEGLAARQAAERIDEAGKEHLAACLARQRGLLELSGHGTAQRLINALHAQTVRYQYRTILIPGRSAASVGEHAAIVDAVLGGRPDDADAAMRRHLFNVAQAVRRQFIPEDIDKASRGAL